MLVLTYFHDFSLWYGNCYWFKNFEWNPNVSPKYGKVDFDSDEILSLETIFSGIQLWFSQRAVMAQVIYVFNIYLLESSLKIEIE